MYRYDSLDSKLTLRQTSTRVWRDLRRKDTKHTGFDYAALFIILTVLAVLVPYGVGAYMGQLVAEFLWLLFMVFAIIAWLFVLYVRKLLRDRLEYRSNDFAKSNSLRTVSGKKQLKKFGSRLVEVYDDVNHPSRSIGKVYGVDFDDFAILNYAILASARMMYNGHITTQQLYGMISIKLKTPYPYFAIDNTYSVASDLAGFLDSDTYKAVVHRPFTLTHPVSAKYEDHPQVKALLDGLPIAQVFDAFPGAMLEFSNNRLLISCRRVDFNSKSELKAVVEKAAKIYELFR